MFCSFYACTNRTISVWGELERSLIRIVCRSITTAEGSDNFKCSSGQNPSYRQAKLRQADGSELASHCRSH